MRRKLLWVSLYAVAMAYLEAAVVVYLRAIYYPDGFAFPIVLIPDRMAAVEIGREAATVAMLLAVGCLSGSGSWQRFLVFAFSFGVWDIFYYVWLRVLLGWPASLLTWDILFLIPVPWIGPVLAPVLVSLALIAASVILLGFQARGGRLRFAAPVWAAAVLGGLLVVGAFMADYEVVLKSVEPPPFRWRTFAAGFGLGLAAFFVGLRKLSGTGAARGGARAVAGGTGEPPPAAGVV